MPPVGHCVLSPSKAESWIPCQPSIKAGREVQDEQSEYAAE
ncbi:MAG: DUF2800 domain-containing protein, partial [Lachnospiraceae bacterium]|nr:DUF2800 domain-containing protein [Lachnospiraceae bacterium]